MSSGFACAARRRGPTCEGVPRPPRRVPTVLRRGLHREGARVDGDAPHLVAHRAVRHGGSVELRDRALGVQQGDVITPTLGEHDPGPAQVDARAAQRVLAGGGHRVEVVVRDGCEAPVGTAVVTIRSSVIIARCRSGSVSGAAAASSDRSADSVSTFMGGTPSPRRTGSRRARAGGARRAGHGAAGGDTR
jgi:hypothetical protein